MPSVLSLKVLARVLGTVLPVVAGAPRRALPRFSRRVSLPWVLALLLVTALTLFAVASDEVQLFCSVYPVVSNC
jgi:hypothetical protein